MLKPNWLFYAIEEIEENKRGQMLGILSSQFDDIILPNWMKKIDSSQTYGSFSGDRNYTDFVVSMLIKTDKSEEEVRNFFESYSFESVNKVFKTEPRLTVRRVETTIQACENDITGEIYYIKKENASEKKYYIVMLTDKARI